MEKVLFVHDGPLRRDSDDNYYGVQAGDTQRQRYLSLGDSITYMMRLKMISDAERSKYSLIKKEKFSFVEVPNFLSISKLSNRKKAAEIIKREVDNHDIIVVRLPSATGYIAFNYAKKINKPILVELVACVHDSLYYYDWRGKLMAKLKMLQYKKTLQKANHVIYVTDKYLQQKYPSPSKSVNCSNVVVNYTEDSVLEKRLAKIDNKPSDEIMTLCTVAAIDVKYKGQAEVIKAVSILKKQNIFVKYKIVGQGNPERLNNIIQTCGVEDLVDIVGPVKHDKVFEFIDGVDVYVQPSKTEGLPRAVIEALSRGCPSIGSRVGGIPELIQQELLFNSESTTEIAEVIKRISNKDLQRKVAKENFEKAKEYQFEIIDKRRKSFYKEFKNDSKLI
ncbi:glycosyltransferase family 4 protein [Flavobacterium litorale]|uniref:Glycosyltransferase family 4 protein n=1 Tax=Flavobacterium litorale TaxID=2856519 RepID=A0ABX8V383_9FLAO|nr:glycosyltransferase family 4 protein [Flavobacterium litorale]QYJ67304.1 glycosyltransferase family 4 protein [Flavobacterium litorale]